jgi:phage terminase Nu1 subunit (DNA packaging protein)
MRDKFICTGAELADLFGTQPSQIQQYVRNGLPVLPDTKPPRFYLPDVWQWLTEKNSNTAALIEVERLRKITVEANLLEIKQLEEEGKLVHVEEVVLAYHEDLARLKGKLLSLPTKLAPRLEITDSITEKEKILEEEIYEALEELALAVKPAEELTQVLVDISKGNTE